MILRQEILLVCLLILKWKSKEVLHELYVGSVCRNCVKEGLKISV